MEGTKSLECLWEGEQFWPERTYAREGEQCQRDNSTEFLFYVNVDLEIGLESWPERISVGSLLLLVAWVRGIAILLHNAPACDWRLLCLQEDCTNEWGELVLFPMLSRLAPALLASIALVVRQLCLPPSIGSSFALLVSIGSSLALVAYLLARLIALLAALLLTSYIDALLLASLVIRFIHFTHTWSYIIFVA